MDSILIKNIRTLLQVNTDRSLVVSGLEMDNMQYIDHAYLFITDHKIAGFGPMAECPTLPTSSTSNIITEIDAQGKFVLPAWCDSHTHLVYAGDRSQEFEDRINGCSYTEIAQRGGGILNSAKRMAEVSEDVLYAQAFQRLNEIMALGTGAVEIKSGYGLNIESEMKMLRVITRLRDNHPISIKRTFLGAHAFPYAYKDNHKGYVDLIVDELIPIIAKAGLADYIDVFCEQGYFSVCETHRILAAGQAHGLTPKTHVNQFHAIGGIAASITHKALSVDHLEVMAPEDYIDLANSSTIATLLPACSYFLSIPYAPARKLMEKNIPIALASDFNPGSCPSGNMNFVVSTACIKMRMTPYQAITAATINGAYAMGLSDKLGSIAIGNKANIIITQTMHTAASIPYYFGANPVDKLILNGEIVINHTLKNK